MDKETWTETFNGQEVTSERIDNILWKAFYTEKPQIEYMGRYREEAIQNLLVNDSPY